MDDNHHVVGFDPASCVDDDIVVVVLERRPDGSMRIVQHDLGPAGELTGGPTPPPACVRMPETTLADQVVQWIREHADHPGQPRLTAEQEQMLRAWYADNIREGGLRHAPRLHPHAARYGRRR